MFTASIRTFVIRESRMTPCQQKAFETSIREFGIFFEPGEAFDSMRYFGNKNPVVVEIGFGMGDSLAWQAENYPNYSFIGIEVHRPGIGRLLHSIQIKQLKNLRIIYQDAVEILTDYISPDSIDGFQIFFPDPWPKTRHHKRRMIRPEFLRLLLNRLKLNGHLHIATDWADYAKTIERDILSIEEYGPEAEPSLFSDGLVRPETKFEKRAQKCSHSIFEFRYQKR